MSAGSTDQFGRRIEYLRISVTDRCNFRCAYCMPLEGLPWLPRAEILSYEEITEIVRQLAPLGVSRLRITGGEPTIRPQLSTLIAMLRAVPGIEDIALSTNGVKLPEMADELKAAGLDRVNMSADSLQAGAHPRDRPALAQVRTHRCGECGRARGAGPREDQYGRHARDQRR